MPRDAVSRTANVERTVRHKWVKKEMQLSHSVYMILYHRFEFGYILIFFLTLDIDSNRDAY